MPKVLIVDDDPPTVELIKFTLEAEGITTLSATDGIDALKVAESEIPDLILLDIMMPDMDGFQVCQLIKNNEKLKNVPIVMLTAKTQKTDRFWGREKGADDYFTKPFDPTWLAAKVKEILQTRGHVLE